MADQDDIWVKEKVEKTVEVFEEHDVVELVISDGTLIDKDGRQIEGVFSHHIAQDSGMIDGSRYLERSVWSALANGMCMCIKRELLKDILPFPDSKAFHDRWIAFGAMCRNSGYFLNEKLVGYRIHDTNTSMRGNRKPGKRFEKAIRDVYHIPYDLYNMGSAMAQKLEDYGLSQTSAYKAALRIRNLQYDQIQAAEGFFLAGICRFIKLYRTDALYRSNGIKYLLMQMFTVVFGRGYVSQNKRTICSQRGK